MKKRVLTVLLAFALLCSLGTAALAADTVRAAELTYRGISVKLNGETLALIDGSGNGVEPFILEGTTYLPLRAVAGALGLEVSWDDATSTVSLQSGGQPADGGQQESTPTGSGGVSYRTVSVKTGSGAVSAHVIAVDMKNSGARVRPGLAGSVLCSRNSLANIVAAAGNPTAVITANFMTSDKEGNYPVGNLMIDGELLFTGSGISSIGIKSDGSMICGRPNIRARVVPDGTFPLWNANAVNVPEEEISGNLSALYTPAKGSSFSAVCGGTVLTVSAGAVSSFGHVDAGAEVPIPADGYVLIMTDEFMKYVNDKYRAANIGESVSLEYFINGTDTDGGFNSLDGVSHIISGGPRLVKNGAVCTELEPQFSEARFTTISSSRTCAGYTSDGKLLLVSSSGTIDQMRELMLSLGCVEAINLDGGASAALYYGGRTLVPEGRLLAYVLQVYAG